MVKVSEMQWYRERAGVMSKKDAAQILAVSRQYKPGAVPVELVNQAKEILK